MHERKVLQAARNLWLRITVLVILLSHLGTDALAYRPFESTDAPVVAMSEVEIELGITLGRHPDETALRIPGLGITYGVMRDLEVGMGTSVDLIDDREPFRLGFRDTKSRGFGMSAKGILSHGSYRAHTGWKPMRAIEVSAVAEQLDAQDMSGDAGAVLAASGWLGALIYHLNIGGVWETDTRDPGVSWGAVVEYPMTPSIRPVFEVHGDNLTNHLPKHSFLGALIWTTPWDTLEVDVGGRRRLTEAGPEWAVAASGSRYP